MLGYHSIASKPLKFCGSVAVPPKVVERSGIYVEI
jgi:hypothetical protein